MREGDMMADVHGEARRGGRSVDRPSSRAHRARAGRTRAGRVSSTVGAVLLAGVITGCAASGTASPPPAESPSSPAASSGSATRAPGAGSFLTLSDQGVAGLRLGMTLQEAQASGLLGRLDPDFPPGEACQRYEALEGLDHVWVDTATRRVVEIVLGPALRTDKGIGAGDTYQQVHDAYPDVAEAFHRAATVKAPNAAVKASYDFSFLGTSDTEYLYPEDRVLQISLAADSAPCHN